MYLTLTFCPLYGPVAQHSGCAAAWFHDRCATNDHTPCFFATIVNNMRAPFFAVLSWLPTIIFSQQIPMNPNAAPTTNPTIADLLTIEPSVSIFYSYARELALSGMFSSTDQSITVLVPTNKAVMALARKPHQPSTSSPDDIEISEEEFDNQSKENVQRWVGSHIIAVRAHITLSVCSYSTDCSRNTHLI